jgi:hypothetical protein
MHRFSLGILVSAALVGASPAADLCITTGANNRNFSIPCNGGIVQNLHYGFAETGADWCRFDGCPNYNGDCGLCMSGPFLLGISRSDVDPHDHIGPLMSDVLYLWLEVCSSPGWKIAEFSLGGSLTVQSFAPASGFRNVGTDTELGIIYDPACLPSGTYLVGTIHLESPVPVDATTWGHTKALYRD